MRVADTNLIAYMLIDGPFTDSANRVHLRDPRWIAPVIWHSELLNVLATSVREEIITIRKARDVLIHSPAFIEDYELSSLEVLDLSVESKFATFDCFYVFLARKLDLKLVTADKKLLRQFTDVAVSIDDFANGK